VYSDSTITRSGPEPAAAEGLGAAWRAGSIGDRLNAIVGVSPAIRELRTRAAAYAKLPWTVLIQGETGTGKELLAQAIHESSDRASHRLLFVNCAAVPEALLENEFFGHVRGAFTGADRNQPGVFSAADHGTLVLDEIGELPLRLQAKLLRVLESRSYRPLGGTTEVRSDVRLIASTNRDLSLLVGEGQFRTDLFYRLDVLKLHIPPLRERREDILPLATSYLRRLAPDGSATLSPDASARILAGEWPGNVRQLQHVLLRALVDAGGGTIRERHLGSPPTGRDSALGEPETGSGTLQPTMRAVEGQIVMQTLDRHKGNKSAAARELGLTYRGLFKKLQRFGAT
jgi:transcriptional regulator with PAS, ATPase and Fis domain